MTLALAKRLQTYRESHGLGKSEMSKRIGVAPQMYTKYEAGTAYLPPEARERFAAMLGCPASDLIALEPEILAQADRFQDRLSLIRKTRCLTIKDLSTSVRTAPRTICSLEAGSMDPWCREGILERIQAALDCTLEDLGVAPVQS